jgi:hypothetical protein
MKKLFVCLLLSFVLFGCEDFLDVNTDPDSPTTSTPDFLLPPVMAWTATSVFDHGEEIAYLTQQLATFSGFNKYHDRWDYVTANRIGQWRRHYHDISVNAQHTITAAERENATNYIGVAKILYAFSTLRTTAIFGDMPYFDALKGNASPPYDPQSEIYEQVIIELDEAIELLQNTNTETVRPLTASQDNIYKGNLNNWIGFANAIKARALLHLTPHVTQNYTDVIAAVDEALNNWTDATFDYSLGIAGNTLQMNQWGPSQADPDWNYGNNTLNSSAPGRFMLEEALKYDPTTNTVGDPRTPYLMKPNADSAYLSIIPSTGKVASFDDEEYPDLFGSYITQDYGPIYLFREEELHFIKAEAMFNQGDANGAYTAFVEGITVNMDRAGVPGAEGLAFLGSSMLPQSGNELTLSAIMMQKYVALWLDGEVWTDMRRYGYDAQIYTGLQQPPNLIFYFNEGEWIQRLPYDTETEEIYNKPELDRLGAFQNPEWLKVPMIWSPK